LHPIDRKALRDGEFAIDSLCRTPVVIAAK